MSGPLTLAEAHAGYHTRLRRADRDDAAPWLPPEELFRLIRYAGPLGGNASFLANFPPPGLTPQPAVLWLAGEFAHALDERVWTPGSCDYTSRPLREAGLCVLHPGLRGWDDNPGVRETFFGEVEDVIAAAEALSRRPRIDPARHYLVGHSTGGTLALLTAECTARFRAVFCFGPVDRITHYPEENLTFEPGDLHEAAIRSPVHWLRDLRTPTFIFEGTEKSNISCLQQVSEAPHSEYLSVHPVPGANHFNLVRRWPPSSPKRFSPTRERL